MISQYKKQPVLYTLATLGCLFIMMLFLSLYIPPKEVEVIREVEVEKIIYKDRIEYKNINVFISGMTINTVIKFYKDNLPSEYEKILKFYDRYTKSRAVSKTIIEQALKIGTPIHLSFGLAERESQFNYQQESRNSDRSWDRGLFQLNSASRPKWKRSDYFNIEKNTFEGLSCLKWLLDEFPDHDLSVAAYNAGYGNITKKIMPFTTAVHVFEIKDNELKYDVAFNTILLPSLSNIQYSEGLFKLVH